jgi:hypothetical protein
MGVFLFNDTDDRRDGVEKFRFVSLTNNLFETIGF